MERDRTMDNIFTVEELAFGEQHPALGPEYEGARNAAEAFMAKFEAEHFKPLVDQFADAFRDKLWSDLSDWLIGDTESNLQSEMRRMIEGTVNALLSGEQWALNRYVMSGYHDGEKIRKAVALHIEEEVAKARITDLEKEVTRLREQLEWARR